MESVVDVGGAAYTIASDDEYLAHLGPVFEPDTVALFKALAHGVALDVGANIGCTALALSQLCERVHAFEPSPSTHAFLSANVASSPKITTYNFGLGDRNHQSELTYAENNRSGGFVSDKTHACDGHTVERIAIRKLDSVRDALGIDRVDFIKIDVEGFEGHVLRGAKRTLRKLRPLVALELNHWCLNAFQRTSVPDFFDQLRATFPILLAVHGENYLSLHAEDESYIVMYRHIVLGQYATIVGAYDEAQLAGFRARYSRTTE